GMAHQVRTLGDVAAVLTLEKILEIGRPGDGVLLRVQFALQEEAADNALLASLRWDRAIVHRKWSAVLEGRASPSEVSLEGTYDPSALRRLAAEHLELTTAMAELAK